MKRETSITYSFLILGGSVGGIIKYLRGYEPTFTILCVILIIAIFINHFSFTGGFKNE